MSTSAFFAQYDELLSESERAVVERAGDFCTGKFSKDLQRAHAQDVAYPWEWISEWASRGMLGLQAKPEHGGLGMSFLCKIRVAQEMARHGFAAAFCFNNLQGQVTRISQAGNEEQRQRLLPGLMDGTILSAPAMSEPNGGSDLAALTTTATAVGGGWRINGAKAWVTNGTIVDYVSMLVRIEGSDDLATLIVPCGQEPTLVREEILLPGGRSYRLARLTMNDHVVPHWAVLGGSGDALRAAMAAVNAARVHVAAMCVAALQSVLCDAVRYCGGREAFGRPVLAHQGLQWQLADVATRLEAASALVFRAAQLIDRQQPAVTIAAQSKRFAVDTAVWGMDQCVRAMGAVGATADQRLAMQISETRLAAFADGTGEMMLDRVGRSLAKDYGAFAITHPGSATA